MITRQMIIETFSNTVYRRGLHYFRDGRVNNLIFDKKADTWHANVVGSDNYLVEITPDDKGFDYYCECPAYHQYDECKHVVATLLEILEKDKLTNTRLSKQQRVPRQPDYTEQLIQLFSAGGSSGQGGIEKTPLKTEYTIKAAKRSWRSDIFSLEMKVGIDRTYVIKNLKDFLRHIELERELIFTKKFAYDPNIHQFQAEDQEIINILLEINQGENFYQDSWQSSPNQKGITIPPLYADRLFSRLAKRECSFDHGNDTYPQIEWVEHQLPFVFKLEKGKNQDFSLDLPMLNTRSIYEDYGVITDKEKFYKLTKRQQHVLMEIAPLLNRPDQQRHLPIKKEQIDSFLSHVIPKLETVGTIEMSKKMTNDIIKPPLKARLYLDQQEERLTAKVAYHYGDIVIDPFQKEIQNLTEQILMRNVEQEQAIMNVIEHASFKFNGHELYLDDEDDIFSFLYDYLPQIENKAEIYMTNPVRKFLLEDPVKPTVRVDLDHSENYLEVQFDFADIDPTEIEQILQSVTEKKRYHRLPNGTFVPLEDESFSPITQLLAELNLKPDHLKNGQMTLPAYRGLQLEEFVSKQASAKYNKAFRQLIQDIKHPDESEYPLPVDLKANMRDYQNVGFQWLKALSHYHFGGILADDMGLGKTLQSIAYLLSEQETLKDHPALVISPASLVFNWKSEFEKFAPSLSVLVVSGSKAERETMLTTMPDADVIVTSYPLIRQDIELYSTQDFSVLILDEAQAIKNQATKTAKAIKSIRASKRFALSGTPIENSLDELWALFDAILPGFFPNKKDFSRLSQEQISRMSRPFILRRMKKDVLKELPDKIETVHTSELTKEQKKLYLAYLEKIQGEATNSIATEGFQKSRMKILAGLTRLRQLCCHPSLFIENYHGESGKLLQLMEMVETALANGGRLLIFSQFSSMLKIIKKHLADAHHDAFYLDGQTPSKDRVEMAEKFNQGENSIFLISLKAGGTGLNLTGADTVILYDLWWNPAVEEQAAGRAHRMGQKKVVQVYRLITEGTIEEKIFALQQKKRELIENIIQPGETMFSSLKESDILELLSI